jgi:hypothetical protein
VTNNSGSHESVPGLQQSTRDVPLGTPRIGLMLLMVSVAAALPFFPALGGPFFWDDTHLILNNPHVHSFSHIGHSLTHSFFDTGPDSGVEFIKYFRPLLHLSYALDWKVGSGNPAVFHATNLVLAMCATWLVASSIGRWTRLPGWACLMALLWAWHPTKSESVSWISGRTDLLVTIFILIVCRARAMRADSPRASWGIEIVATVLAYASKETAILLPLFLCIESWSKQRHPALTPQVVVTMLKSSAGHVLLALAYIAARSRWLPVVALHDATMDRQLPMTRIGLILETFGRAVQLSVFPYVQSAEHGLATFESHNQLIISRSYAALGGLCIAAFIGLIVITRRKAPAIALGAAAFVVALLPTANLIPTHLESVIYERFLYLPTIGLALLFTGIMLAVVRSVRARRGLTFIFTCALVVAGLKSTARAQDYADPERFWTHERAVNPLSIIAEQGLVEYAQLHGRGTTALENLVNCHRNANMRRQSRIAIRCAYDGALMVADSVADLDTASLKNSERIFRAFAQPNNFGAAQMDVLGISLSINLANPVANEVVREMQGESLAILATIELRLQDPEAARDARAAIKRCPSCRHVLRAVRVLAATDHVAEALGALEPLWANGPLQSVENVREQIEEYAKWKQHSLNTQGPPSIHAEAQADLALGLFGAAYRVLSPHAREFSNAPEYLHQFARVAALAGDEATARDALLQLMNPNDVQHQLDEWVRPHLVAVHQ